MTVSTDASLFHTNTGTEKLIEDVETTIDTETIFPTPANQHMSIQESASNESQDMVPTTSQLQLKSMNSHQRRKKISNILIFSLLTLMVMFCVGTPLTLILTVPAYILADQVRRI